jgi:hypothetical protein
MSEDYEDRILRGMYDADDWPGVSEDDFAAVMMPVLREEWKRVYQERDFLLGTIKEIYDLLDPETFLSLFTALQRTGEARRILWTVLDRMDAPISEAEE